MKSPIEVRSVDDVLRAIEEMREEMGMSKADWATEIMGISPERYRRMCRGIDVASIGELVLRLSHAGLRIVLKKI